MSVVGAEESDAGGAPSYLTGFFGRGRELEVLHHWARSARGRRPVSERVTTIVGLGGAGKTRLAYELAARFEDDTVTFPDGVTWVDLVATEFTDVRSALARAAGVRGPAPGEDAGSLRRALARRRSLIVLDNCEHMTEPCQLLIGEVVAHCPGLVLLATSRTPLFGSRTFELSGLQCRSDVGGVRTDAMRLFYDRAGMSLSRYATLATDHPVIAAICERLDGLPLAIELAAPWLRTLSATDVLDQLGHGQRILAAAGGWGGSERHASLVAVLDSTWAWLTAEEQAVLVGLGVFIGGVGRDGAEAVTGATLPVLSSLTERSLIRRVPTADDTTRYVLHEVVRHYLQDRLIELPAHEVTALHRRHLGHLLQLANQFSVHRNSPDEARWLARLQQERGNLEAAITRGVDRGDAEPVLLLVGNLLDSWIYEGPVNLHRREIENALTLTWDETSLSAAAARARVAYAAGWANFDRPDEDRGRPHIIEALALYRRLDDIGEQAVCLRALSRMSSEDGDHAAGERLARQSLGICRRGGDELGACYSEVHLAEELWAQGHAHQAEAQLIGAIATFRRLNVAYGAVDGLISLGEIRRHRRDWSAALGGYMEALAIVTTTGIDAELHGILRGLAAVAAELGSPSWTARLCGAADAWQRVRGVSHRAVVEPTSNAEDAARSALGNETWAATYRYGRRLPPEEVPAAAVAAVADLAARNEGPPAGLTAREVDVLRLVAEGLSNDELASRLVISPRTVHAHLRSIFAKLAVSSRTAAVHAASRQGLSL